MDYLVRLNKAKKEKGLGVEVKEFETTSNSSGMKLSSIKIQKNRYTLLIDQGLRHNMHTSRNINGSKEAKQFAFSPTREVSKRVIQIEEDLSTNITPNANLKPRSTMKRNYSQTDKIRFSTTDRQYFSKTYKDFNSNQDPSVQVGGIVKLDKRINDFRSDYKMKKNQKILHYICHIQREWRKYRKTKNNKLIVVCLAKRRFENLKFSSPSSLTYYKKPNELNKENIFSYEILNKKKEIPFSMCSNVNLEINNKILKDDKISQVDLIPKFDNLELEQNDFKIDCIKKILTIHKLENNFDLKGIKKLPKFEILSKNYNDVFEIESIKKIPKFEILTKYSNDEFEIESIKKIPKFEILSKYSRDIFEIKSIKKIPKFEILTKNSHDKFEIRSIKKIPKFEILSKNSHDKFQIERIKKLPKFEILSKNSYGKFEIESIKKIPKFDNLYKNSTDKFDFDSIKKIPKFEILYKIYNNEFDIECVKKTPKLQINKNNQLNILGIKKIPLQVERNKIQLEIISKKKQNLVIVREKVININSKKKNIKLEIFSDYRNKFTVKGVKKLTKIIQNNSIFTIKGISKTKDSIETNTNLILVNKEICDTCSTIYKIGEICRCKPENEHLKNKHLNIRVKVKKIKEEEPDVIHTNILDNILINKSNYSNAKTDKILNSFKIKDDKNVINNEDVVNIFKKEKNKKNIEITQLDEIKNQFHVQNLLSKNLKRNSKNQIHLRQWEDDEKNEI